VFPTLAKNGIALYAVSYDAVDILRAFADEHGISFPLLSDQASHVMRRLGLINERVQEDHAAYGIPANPRHQNLPYPGVFVLDEAGIVTRRRFHESYRERDTGTGLIATALGIHDAPSEAIATSPRDVVSVRAWLDSPTYGFFQRLLLTVEITVAPGFHVYGNPAAEGTIPLSVEVTPIEGVEVGAATWPAPGPFRVNGLDVEFRVHDGTIRGFLPVVFSGPPGAGDHILEVAVTHQACDASSCLAPASTRFELVVKEVGLVGRPLAASAPKPPAGR
jgi:hypothetical protein